MAAAQQLTPYASENINSALARVAARHRGQNALRGAVRGAAVALGINIILAYLARVGVLALSPSLAFDFVLITAAGAGVGAAFVALHAPLAPMDAASLAEARLPLKERLSSSLELETLTQPGPLAPLQHADADTYARTVDPRRVVPLRAPRETWLLPPLLLLLALTFWLPSLPFAETPAARAERLAVQHAGNTLLQTARHLEHSAAVRHDPASRAAARRLETVGRRMAQGRLDKTQSLAALSEEDKRLAAQQSFAQNADPGQAARALAGMGHAATAAGKPSASHSASAPSTSSGSQPPATPPGSPSSSAAAQSTPPPTSASSGPKPSNGAPQEGASSGNAPSNQEARQAVDNARRQMTQDSSPSTSRPGDSSRPGEASHSGSPSRPGAGSHPGSAASGQSSHGQSSQGQSSQGQPSPGASTHPGNGSRGSGPSQPSSGGEPGSASPGGADAGQDHKFAFHGALPPLPAHGAPLSLGAPPVPGGKTVPLARQSGPPEVAPGPSRVPYGTALPAARQGAEAALQTQNVPPSRRAAVRDYFNSLQNPK